MTGDAMDAIELRMAFEKEFALKIADSDAEAMMSVGDVVDYVVGKFLQNGGPIDALAVFYRVRRVTSKLLCIDPQTITRGSRFVEDLGL